MAAPGQPEPLFRAVQDELGRLFGHRLFTLMLLDEPAGEAARVWTDRPDVYPVGGRKPLGAETAWGRHVLLGKRSWLGATMAEIRAEFPDHELIGSLGLGACINLVVLFDGVLLGTVNMLDAEGRYDEALMEAAAPFAALLVPAFQKLLRAA